MTKKIPTTEPSAPALPLPRFRARTTHPRCLESHPALPVGSHLIYGGSCSSPMVTNADIYIGFDFITGDARAYPWNAGPVSVHFPIPDMGIPKDPAEFRKMVDWLSVQLTANKLIHLGCIGGHGRTGMALAALVKVVTGEVNAIQYVRKHYCEKAVESKAQIDFLMREFGVSEAPATKGFHAQGKAYHGSDDWYKDKGYPTSPVTTHRRASQSQLEQLNRAPLKVSVPNRRVSAEPLRSAEVSLWGSTTVFDKLQKVV